LQAFARIDAEGLLAVRSVRLRVERGWVEHGEKTQVVPERLGSLWESGLPAGGVERVRRGE
jgi:hypothetical protein